MNREEKTSKEIRTSLKIESLDMAIRLSLGAKETLSAKIHIKDILTAADMFYKFLTK